MNRIRIKLLFKLISFFVLASSYDCSAMKKFLWEAVKGAGDVIKGVNDVVRDVAQEKARLYENAEEYKDEAERLAKLLAGFEDEKVKKGKKDIGTKTVPYEVDSVFDEVKKTWKTRQDIENEIKHNKREHQKCENIKANMKVGEEFVKKIGENAEKRQNHKMKLEEIGAEKESKVAVAQEKAKGIAQAATNGVKEFFKSLQDKNTLAAALLLTVGISGLYYATKFGYEYAMRSLGVPELLQETSKLSFKEWLYESLGLTPERPEPDLSQIVFHPEVKAAIDGLAEDTKETAALGLTYRNVLFYGPPGTGKTAFAKLLAYYSGMDYAIMSGANFDQFNDEDRIAKLNDLFNWAEKKSDRGVIIFIDEADACFRDRSTLNRAGVSLVNAFLARTGESSNKFMIILATNYEDELDAAVLSRVHSKIPILLPGLEERFQIIKKKFEKHILGDERTYVVDGEEITAELTVAPDIDDDYIKAVAASTDGFSGRDIEQMVTELKLRAYRSGQNAVTKDIMEYVVAQKKAAVEKTKKTAEYQRQRSEAAKKKNQQVD